MIIKSQSLAKRQLYSEIRYLILTLLYVCVLSCVWLFVVLCTAARQAPLSTGFFQAGIREWVAISFRRESSSPRKQTCVSCVSCFSRQILYYRVTWKPVLPQLLLSLWTFAYRNFLIFYFSFLFDLFRSIIVIHCMHVFPVASAMSDSLRPYRLQSARLLCPWGSPGKNTGVVCHFLLQGIFQIHGWSPTLLH